MSASNTAAVLNCSSITSGYGDIVIIRDVSITVSRGKVVTVLGKNGMGKTTFLKTIMGFLKSTGGKIELFGEDATGKEPQWLVERGVAYVPQEEAIFQDLTVEDNLRLGTKSDRFVKDGIARIEPFFPVIAERLRQKAGTLSGGEQKMLLMSRALMSQPKLLLIDEISEGLQPTMVSRIVEVLTKLSAEEDTSILMAEQNIKLVNRISHEVALINTGRITQRRSLDDTGRNEGDLIELMRL